MGTTLAYQLSKAGEGKKIVVIEKEEGVARHTSSRNTGVLHRPFYLDPDKKGKFARCAQESYEFWKEYAAAKGLPWREVGTIEVALTHSQLEHLEHYKQWARANGMQEDEVQLLNPDEIRQHEPNVRAVGALWCKTDTAVDFAAFTRALKADAQKNGVKFLMGCEVKKVIEDKDGVEIVCEILHPLLTSPIKGEESIGNSPPPVGGVRGGGQMMVRARYIVNCAGGAALRIAHTMGLAREYADINFRGEYLIVEGQSASLASANIYSVPRHTAFPFLDPHFVVHYDGRVEIGPTAVPVFGEYTYKGLGNIVKKCTERPWANKLKLFTNPEFLRLCSEEWRSVLSKKIMVERVRRFLPALRLEDCTRRGIAGVRASLIDREGRFVPEVIEVESARSLHILNYNSPGATGAPAYAKYLTSLIRL